MNYVVDCSRFFDEEMAYYYTEGVVYLNFHFIRNSNSGGNFGPTGDNNQFPNDENNNGINMANDILYRLNQLTEELLEDPVAVIDNIDHPSQRKLPWRFELYTHPNNTADIYDGIWFWDNPYYEDDLNETDYRDLNYNHIINNYQPYGNDVLDVYFVEFDLTSTSQDGYAPETNFNSTDISNNKGKGIFLYNMWKNYNDRMSQSMYSNHWSHGFTLNHEIGHVMSGIGGHVENPFYICSDAQTNDPLTNNVMHGAVLPWRTAWTPCQVNRMYANFQNSSDRRYYRPTEACTTDLESLVIDEPNAVFQTQITLDRNIEIENGAKLTVQCLLNMPDLGKIKVKPGGELVLEGGTITSGCAGEQWFGIQVFGNKQDQNGNLQGRFTSYPNSTINNAIISISNPHFALYNALFPSIGGGSILDIEGTTFLNNSISIALYPYKSFNSSGNIVLRYPAFISNSWFLTDDAYIDDLYAYPVQLQLLGVNGPRIRNTSFINERTDVDDLDLLGIGIFSFGSGFAAALNDELDNPIIQGYQFGVAAFGGFNDFVYSIDGYEFKENFVGVSSMGVDKFTIQSCDIEVGGLDMPYNIEGNDIHEGISVLTGSTFTIRNNEFTGADNTPIPPVLPGDFFDPVKYGLRVLNSGMTTSIVRNNSYKDLYIANKAEGLNRNPFQSAFGLVYNCNENENFDYDFIVQKINDEDGILFNQGARSNPAKNTFTQLEDLFGSDFINGSDWPIQYWYYDGIPNHEPLHYYSTKNFIKRDVEVLGAGCGIIGAPLPVVEIDSIKKVYFQADNQFDSLSEVRNDLIDDATISTWLSRLNVTTANTKATFLTDLYQLSPYTSEALLDAILSKTSLFTLSEITTILQQNSHFYLFQTLKEKATNLWSISDNTLNDIFNNYNSDLLRLDSDISVAAYTRAMTLGEILFYFASDSLMRDSIDFWLHKVENIEYSYMLVDQALGKENFEEANDVLLDIPNTFDLDTRMENLHTEYTTWKDLAKDMSEEKDDLAAWLNANETSLLALAQNSICKPAAFARGLLKVLDSSYNFYWPPLETEEVIEVRSFTLPLKPIEPNSFKIHPNPVNNKISFEYLVRDNQSVFVQIFDLNGKSVLNHRLMSGKLHILDVNSLVAGMYYINIISDFSKSGTCFIKTN